MSVWLWIVIGVPVFVVMVMVGLGIVASGMDISFTRDDQGNITLFDTPGMRTDATFAYDENIIMEKRGQQLSNGMSWNEVWLNTILAIRGNTENPEWYVQYIIEQRRMAGLPELEGLDEESSTFAPKENSNLTSQSATKSTTPPASQSNGTPSRYLAQNARISNLTEHTDLISQKRTSHARNNTK